MSELVFVGTGDAFGSGGRRNSAILVRDRGRTLLMDCGPTTLGGLKALGIDPREIDAIVVTHFHGDHVAGVPFMLLDYLYENRRSTPLSIIGPAGTRERVEHIASAFEYSNQAEAYRLQYAEFEVGKPLDIEGFRITPAPAHHNPCTHPHMLRVETETRALCYSGDTGWHPELPSKVGDVDLFICECVFVEEGSYDLHMAAEQLDRARQQFRCADFRLTHLGSEVLENMDRVRFDTVEDGTRLTL